ncbi:XRE family transcriptional regulator [Cryobacterium sp. MDB1-18-2]|uniref:helix-turn-helix domain-containing protein n=1 Tax=unclassified Cryobacterium TaxID=2649013 RepID=UPI001069802E|nr:MULTISPECIES: helix-turn-helix transcriptional regulator [unclassified Cryobacterium]TFC30082.1 XRE family transcriptional regulator [Cryobacterium sp. MDB1-18-2]TFC41362.1 XRE family transcriptional regulator [Cryobacterium sp. MDB1-18-1]
MAKGHSESNGVPEWTLADRLRKARRSIGQDQRGFAELIGCTPSAYAQWETGRVQPRDVMGLALRIQELTNVSAAWLVHGDGMPFSER